MEWLLVVLIMSYAERPNTLFQTPIATEELCKRAAAQIHKDFTSGPVTTVHTTCLKVSN